MHRIRVAADRWNFEEDGTGKPFVPLGGNILDHQHPVQGTLFQRFDLDDCDRRLGLMAEVGLNTLRQAIGVNEVFDPRRGLKADGMRNWDAFIALCAKHGIRLMPVGGYIGGNDWFDVERLADSGAQLDACCAFWRAFAGHYAGHGAILAWDLKNELLYWDKGHFPGDGGGKEAAITATLLDGWPAWLEARYGSVAAMNRAYGAAHVSFAAVPGWIGFRELPFQLHAYDLRCYLNERGFAWCKRQVDVLRSVCPGTMVCSGNNGWLSPDQDLFLANGFHNRAIHELFDFVTHHPYPALQAKAGGRGDPLDGGAPARYWLDACIGMSRLDHYGKPVVIQEFGWYGGGTSRFIGELPFRSEEAHAAYTEELVENLLPHSVGFVNWPTFDMPESTDISNHGGIFTHDGRPKALTAVYRRLAARLVGRRQIRAAGTETITASLLGLYTSRPYQDELWDRVHACLRAGGTPDFRFI